MKADTISFYYISKCRQKYRRITVCIHWHTLKEISRPKNMPTTLENTATLLFEKPLKFLSPWAYF